MRGFVKLMGFSIVRIADYHGLYGFRGLVLCNIKLSAKNAAFVPAMPAVELAVRRCLLATGYPFYAQSLQYFCYRVEKMRCCLLQ